MPNSSRYYTTIRIAPAAGQYSPTPHANDPSFTIDPYPWTTKSDTGQSTHQACSVLERDRKWPVLSGHNFFALINDGAVVWRSDGR